MNFFNSISSSSELEDESGFPKRENGGRDDEEWGGGIEENVFLLGGWLVMVLLWKEFKNCSEKNLTFEFKDKRNFNFLMSVEFCKKFETNKSFESVVRKEMKEFILFRRDSEDEIRWNGFNSVKKVYFK